MKKILWIFFGLLMLVTVAQVNAETIDDPLLARMATETRTAILNYDSNYILKYVSAEGIVFEDTLYSKEQIISLLKDKQSWLYKYLYSGKSSVKYFFDKAQDAEVKIIQKGANAVMIIYASKNTNEKRMLENCYININDTWYWDGIFSCK